MFVDGGARAQIHPPTSARTETASTAAVAAAMMTPPHTDAMIASHSASGTTSTSTRFQFREATSRPLSDQVLYPTMGFPFSLPPLHLFFPLPLFPSPCQPALSSHILVPAGRHNGVCDPRESHEKRRLCSVRHNIRWDGVLHTNGTKRTEFRETGSRWKDDR